MPDYTNSRLLSAPKDATTLEHSHRLHLISVRPHLGGGATLHLACSQCDYVTAAERPREERWAYLAKHRRPRQGKRRAA